MSSRQERARRTESAAAGIGYANFGLEIPLSSPEAAQPSPQPADDFCSTPMLPDLLAMALDVAFVGINPSLFSAARGHYFARRSNRFWPCVSRSELSRRAREALGVERLEPVHDRALLDFGIGFTDLVKRPTPRAGDLTPAELAAGVGVLLEKIARYRPRVVCFHGVTGYKFVHRTIGDPRAVIVLGLQAVRLGPTRVFLVPNPSGANAHYTPSDQTRWYDRLAACTAAD